MSAKNKPVKKNIQDDGAIRNTAKGIKQESKSDSVSAQKPIQPAEETAIPKAAPANKLIAAFPFVAAIIVFLLVWTENKSEVVDPWYAAVRLVDSSNKATDPQEKTRLLDEGGSQLRSLLKQHPYHARVHFFMGYYFLNTKKWDSAIAEFCETVRIDTLSTVNPIWIEAVNMLGIASFNKAGEQMKAGNAEQAIATLNFALLYNPGSKDVNHQLAVFYHNTGRLDSAIKHYEIAMGADQNDANLRTNLSNAYFGKAHQLIQQKDLKKAADYFKLSAELNPANKAALQNAIGAYASIGDQAAVNALKQKLAN